MSRGKDLAKATGILAFGRVCTQFISFLLLPLYTTVLTPDEYGVFDLLNTSIMLLLPLVAWQTDQGVFRYLLDARGDKKKISRIISSAAFLNTAQCLIYVILMSVFYLIYAVDYVIFLVLDLVASVFASTLLQIARGFGNNGLYALGSFVSAVTAIILNIIFLVFIPLGIWGLLVSLITSQFLTVIVLFFLLRIHVFISIREIDWCLIKTLVIYSLPLVPNSLAWWVINMSGRVIIVLVLGVYQNGLFAIASKFSSAFIAAYNVFNLSWSESISLHYKDEDRDSFFSSTINKVFSLFVLICSLLIALMPIAFPLMIESQYNEAYGQTLVLLCGALVQVFVGLLSALYIALKKTREIAKTSVFAAIISLVLTLLLIRFIGAYAVSVATLLAFILMAFYRLVDIKQYIRFKLDRKIMLLNCCLMLIAFLSFFVNSWQLSVVSSCIIVLLGGFMNKNIIMKFWSIIKLHLN